MSMHYISGETNTLDSQTDNDMGGNLSLEELNDEFKMINSGERRIAIIGTRNVSIMHKQLIETLTYALVQARNTIITSGGSSGVNSTVIEGALKADPNLVEVILPQTLEQQGDDIKVLLKSLKKIEERPERARVDFLLASELCYREIIDRSHQLICFLYHDSDTLQKAIEYAQDLSKITTIFYLD